MTHVLPIYPYLFSTFHTLWHKILCPLSFFLDACFFFTALTIFECRVCLFFKYGLPWFYPWSLFLLLCYLILYASERIWSQVFIINSMLMTFQCLFGNLAIFNQSIRFSSYLSSSTGISLTYIVSIKKRTYPKFVSWFWLDASGLYQLLTSYVQFVATSYLSFPIHSYCCTIVLACIISLCGLYTRFLALAYYLSSFPHVRIVFLLPFSFLHLLPRK